MFRVYRGALPTRERDREATATMLAGTADDGEPSLRVWAPGRQVAFGRRDVREEGYDDAKRAVEERDFPPSERSVGGRVVAYADSTLAFAHAVPLADMRRGMDDRYDAAVEVVVDALRGIGADVEPGEPARSYCPGAHSVRVVDGGKVAGIAQRVRQEAALVSGCVTVAEEGAIRDVLVPVYDALGVPFDPESVGSVAAAGGPSDPAVVRDALESAFVADREAVRLDAAELVADGD